MKKNLHEEGVRIIQGERRCVLPLNLNTLQTVNGLLLLFAMIRSVVKSFKVPDVEVAAARMSNESALTRMTDSTPKKPWSDLTLVLDG